MISSASPTELQRFATTEAARAAELDHQAQRLGAALGHFAATCIEFSPGIDSSLAHPLHDHARSASAIGERTAAVGRQFERADQGSGFRTTLTTLVQFFHGLALRIAAGSGGSVSSSNPNSILQPFRNLALRGATSSGHGGISISLLAWAPAFALIGGTVALSNNVWQSIQTLWQSIQNSWSDWRQSFSAWWGGWRQGIADLRQAVQDSWNDWWRSAQNSWNDWRQSFDAWWSSFSQGVADWWQTNQDSWNNWWQATQQSWDEWWRATQQSWDEWWQNTGDWWHSWWKPDEWWNGITNWWNDLHPAWKVVAVIVGIILVVLAIILLIKVAAAVGIGAILGAIGSFLKGAAIRAIPFILQRGAPWAFRMLMQRFVPWVTRTAAPWVARNILPKLGIDLTKGIVNALFRIITLLFDAYSIGDLIYQFGDTVLTYLIAGHMPPAIQEHFKNAQKQYNAWVKDNVPPEWQGVARMGGPVVAGLAVLGGLTLARRVPGGMSWLKTLKTPQWLVRAQTALRSSPWVSRTLSLLRGVPAALRSVPAALRSSPWVSRTLSLLRGVPAALRSSPWVIRVISAISKVRLPAWMTRAVSQTPWLRSLLASASRNFAHIRNWASRSWAIVRNVAVDALVAARNQAVKGLASIGSRVAQVLAAIRNSPAAIRKWAAETLAALRNGPGARLASIRNWISQHISQPLLKLLKERWDNDVPKWLKETPWVKTWAAQWKDNILKTRINTLWALITSGNPIQAALTFLGYILSGGISGKGLPPRAAILWTAVGESVKALPTFAYKLYQLFDKQYQQRQTSSPAHGASSPAPVNLGGVADGWSARYGASSPAPVNSGGVADGWSARYGASSPAPSNPGSSPVNSGSVTVPSGNPADPTNPATPVANGVTTGGGSSVTPSIPSAPGTSIDPTLISEPTLIDSSSPSDMPDQVSAPENWPSPSDGNESSGGPSETPSAQPDPSAAEDLVTRLREQLRQGTPVESLLTEGAAVRDLLVAGALPETLLLARPTEAMLNELATLAQTDAQVAPLMQRFLTQSSDQRAEGRVTLEAALQAAIGLDLEMRGELTGPLTPAYMPDGRRVLVDANNTPWGFMPALDSLQRGEQAETTFDLPAIIGRLMALREIGLHVVLTTDGLTPSQFAELQAAIAATSFGDRVLLWQPTTSPVPAM